ncbi:hypothetical protein [Candidatus Poriferisocius sp.]|uniref:hypothetical protein n=1 Tax=Candidatus Poriferisocius sp. TaxID=3101276 RepID=UPI003B01FB63
MSAVPEDPLDILGHLQIALAGGFPAAVAASSADRRSRWMRSYVQVATTRDLGEFDSTTGRCRSPLGEGIEAVPIAGLWG